MGNRLAILPPFPVSLSSEGKLLLTKKFVDGVTEYSHYWKGSIVVIVETISLEQHHSRELDEICVNPDDIPFELKCLNYFSPDLKQILREASIVLGATTQRQNHIIDLCQSVGVPFVLVTEYTLQTRLDIIRSQTPNFLKKYWRQFHEVLQEYRQRNVIKRATGVQCNGTPTYEVYRPLSNSPLLYFDTRVRTRDLITKEELGRRLDRLSELKPLRIAYTGRFDPMKGVNHLPSIAREFNRRGINVKMEVIGDGPLRGALEKEALVTVIDKMDFRSELLPYIKTHIDLFLCPHIQGDPSCTYLETLSCGIPIISYANEAFSGIVELAPVGWKIPVGNTNKMAEVIVHLDKNRDELVSASYSALKLAENHTFEQTFEQRVSHLNLLQNSS